MITKFKIFEKVIESDCIFKDENISLRRITSPLGDKGKLFFRFPVDIPELPDVKERKISFVLACLMLLDTEYEKMPEIKNVEIIHRNSRILQESTKIAIIKELLKKTEFENIGPLYSNWEKKIFNDKNIKNFIKRIQDLSLNSKFLEDIFNGLKPIQNDFFEYVKENYEKFEIENSMKKFNL